MTRTALRVTNRGPSGVGPAVNVDRITAAVLTGLAGSGGATVDCHGHPLRSRDGYVVSLAGHEVTLRTHSRRAIATYVREVGPVLTERPDHHIGAWLDRGNLVLDVSRHIACRPDAVRFGQRNGQRFIYDVAAGEVVAVPSLRLGHSQLDR